MICFTNPGEIELDAIRTMGASVKSDSAIGFFGTGLKYALAILVRNQQRVTILSGRQRFIFGSTQTEIRGKQFELVTLNDEKLGFTTELGKTWDLWMAYRELYCNALDESGTVEFTERIPEPAEGHTVIAVDGESFEAEHYRRGENFLIGRTPSQVVEDVEIFDGESQFLYYKGVRVYKFGRPSLKTYNITSRLALNEDRSVKEFYMVSYKIARTINASKNHQFIRDALRCGESYFEYTADVDCGVYSDEFAAVALEEYRRDAEKVNASVRSFVQRLPPDDVYGRIGAEMTRVQLAMLNRAAGFLRTIGFDAAPYRIRVVESLGPLIMARAVPDHKEIIVSCAAFDKGTKFLASTLLEEIIHIREGLTDETRALQTYLFDKIISLGEELAGLPI